MKNQSETDLLEAKKRLYVLLLSEERELTDDEMDVMFFLSKDKDIQAILSARTDHKSTQLMNVIMRLFRKNNLE
jgi:hypothetical protein